MESLAIELDKCGKSMKEVYNISSSNNKTVSNLKNNIQSQIDSIIKFKSTNGVDNKDLENILTSLEAKKISLSNIDLFSKDSENQLKVIEDEINSIKNTTDAITSNMNNTLSSSNLKNQVTNAENTYKNRLKELKDAEEKLASLGLDTTNIKNTISGYENRYNALDKTNLKQYKSDMEAINIEAKQYSKTIKEASSNADTLSKAQEKIANNVDKLKLLDEKELGNQESVNTLNELYESKKKLSSINVFGESAATEIREVTSSVETLENKTKKIIDNISKETNNSNLNAQLDEAIPKLEKLESKLKNLKESNNKLLTDLADKGFDTSSYENKLNLEYDKLNSLNPTNRNKAEINSIIDTIGLANSELSKLQTTFNRNLKLPNDIQKQILSLKDFKFKFGDDSNGSIQAIINKLEELYNQANKLDAVNIDDIGSFDKIESEIARCTSSVGVLKADIKNSFNFDKARSSVEGYASNFINNIKKIENSIAILEGMGFDMSDEKADVEELKQKFIDLVNVNLPKFEENVKDVSEAIEKLSEIDLNKKVVADFKESSDAADKFGENVENGVKKADNSIKKANNSSLGGLRNELSKTNNMFQEFYNTFMTYGLTNIATDGIRRGIQIGIDSLVSTDSGMIEVLKVVPSTFDDSEEGLEKLRTKIYEIADATNLPFEEAAYALKRTIASGISQMDEAYEVARLSGILSNTGDISAEESTQLLTSMRGSYKINYNDKKKYIDTSGEVKEVNALADSVDLLNHVTNTYSSNADDLSKAISQSGGTLQANGTDYYESIALITAANHSIQDGSKIATSFKTLSTNLQGVNFDAKKGVTGLNKYGKALKQLAGIDVFTDKTKTATKSTFQILKELEVASKKMTDADRTALFSTIAGKHNISVLESLISNYSIVEQIMSEVEQGIHIGSAERENNRVLGSLSGHITRLKNSIGEMFNVIASSDVTTKAFDILTNGIDSLTVKFKELDESGELIPTLIGGFKALGSALAFLAGRKTLSFLSAFGSLFGGRGLGSSVKDLNSISSSFNNLSKAKGLSSLISNAGILSGLLGNISRLALGLGGSILAGGVTYLTVKYITETIEQEQEDKEHIDRATKESSEAQEKLNILTAQHDTLERYLKLEEKSKSTKGLTKKEREELQALKEKLKLQEEFTKKGKGGKVSLKSTKELKKLEKELATKEEAARQEAKRKNRVAVSKINEDKVRERFRGVGISKTDLKTSLSYKTGKAITNIENKNKNSNHNILSTIKTINANSKEATQIIDSLEKYQNHRKSYLEQFKNIQESEKDLELDNKKVGTLLRQDLKNAIANYDKLDEKTRTSIDSLTGFGAFNFSYLSEDDYIALEKSILASLEKDGSLPKSLDNIIQAYRNYNKDGDLETLKTTLDKLYPQLSKDLGVTQDKLRDLFSTQGS